MSQLLRFLVARIAAINLAAVKLIIVGLAGGIGAIIGTKIVRR
jgi:hypothetical protein